MSKQGSLPDPLGLLGGIERGIRRMLPVKTRPPSLFSPDTREGVVREAQRLRLREDEWVWILYTATDFVWDWGYGAPPSSLVDLARAQFEKHVSDPEWGEFDLRMEILSIKPRVETKHDWKQKNPNPRMPWPSGMWGAP